MEPLRTVAFIPVRGGSKSIPEKNIRMLAGRPLVHWTRDAALGCARIDRVFVSSDSPRIREVAGEGASDRLSVIDRSAETATDTASTESALLEFASDVAFEWVVLIQATSPLLTSADLDRALAHRERSGADSLVSVTRHHRFRWRRDASGRAVPENYDPRARPRRQDWPGELYESGAFYVTSREALLESRCRISGRVTVWEMPPESAVELDEPADWTVVEGLLRARAAGS